MENLTLYQKILESNLVNFILMVSILTFIFKKAKLGTFIDKMADDIKNSVVSSSEAAAVALKEYKEAKKGAKDTGKIKDEIISCAKEGAKNIENTSLEILKKEENALDDKYRLQIESDTNKAKDEAADEIFENVVKLAEEEVKKRLNDSMQKKIIERCINQISELEEIKL